MSEVLGYVFHIDKDNFLSFVKYDFIISAHKLQIFDNISIAIQQIADLVNHIAAWYFPVINIFLEKDFEFSKQCNA